MKRTAVIAVTGLVLAATPAAAQNSYIQPTPSGGNVISAPGAATSTGNPTALVNPTPKGDVGADLRDVANAIKKIPNAPSTYINPPPTGSVFTPGAAPQQGSTPDDQ
jgi:hypothetical protein